MTAVSFLVEYAVANVLKFTLDGVDTSQRANFDQRRVADSLAATVNRQQEFSLPFENDDPLKIQFLTNYSYRRVRIIDCDGLQYDPTTGFQNAFYYTPTIIHSYTNLYYRADCKFSSINGKMFIYFESGNEYSDVDFLLPTGQIALEGRLPAINAIVGDTLRYRLEGGDFANTTIASIAWDPTLQAQGYLTDVDMVLLSPAIGVVEVIYDEKEADLYEQEIDLSNLLEGHYRIVVELGLVSALRIYTSEKIFVKEVHEDSLAIDYSHLGTYNDADLWNYLYENGWQNRIRLAMDFYKVTPAGEVEADVNDSGVQRLLRAVPFRQLTLAAYNLPDWVIDKLGVIFSHDTKIINEYEWEIENLGAVENVEMANVGTFTINLRQKNDRTKRSDIFSEDLTAYFEPASYSPIAFGGGSPLVSTFHTNSGGTFAFVSLPSWIDADVDTFQDGTVVTFTISANATYFERSITLTAISDAFDGLTATIEFEQLYDTSIPLFIDVDQDPVQIEGLAGSNVLINVSSSGDYDITYSGSHTFTAVKESGYTQVRISEPTENVGPGNRTGIVKLALQANPSIFVEIDVEQLLTEVLLGLLQITPSSLIYPDNGGTQYVDIDALVDCQWQANSSQTWCIVNTDVHVGPYLNFTVFLNGRDLYVFAPRFAVVTLVNILNPSNTLIINVQQN